MRTVLLAAGMALAALPAHAICKNPMKRDVMMFPGFMRTPVPETLPDIAYIRDDGTTGSLDDLRGKPSVVSFWFPQCHGCQHELPSVNAMLADYGQREGLNMLSLSVQGTPDTVQAFLDRKGYDNVDANVDPGAAIFNDLCLAATPVHVVLDTEARMVAAHVGPQDWTGEKATAFLDKLIATGSP